MHRWASLPAAFLSLSLALLCLAVGCESAPSGKPIDEPLDKSDALRADEAMRDSAQDLVREKGAL